MVVVKGDDETVLLLAAIEPSRSQRRLVLAIVWGLVVIFAAAAPFASLQLPHLYATVSAHSAFIISSDLITAVLLYGQFSILRSRALLILAGGYLLEGWLVIPIALTYPGLFSAAGLLGGGLQTASWLYVTYHVSFSLAVLGYTILKDRPSAVSAGSVKSAILWSVVVATALAWALTWLFTGGNDLVPRLTLDETTLAPIVFDIGLLLTALVAGVIVCLWFRRRTALDQWLLVVLLAFLLETIMSNVLNASRFSVGFYAGMLLVFFNATLLMVGLLSETSRLYARNVWSLNALRRERQNKLINLEAMAASISHEVKQPLSAIVLNSEAAAMLLKKSPPDLDSAAEALHDIQGDVRRTSAVFATIGTLFGRTRGAPEPVDLNLVAKEALRVVRTEIARHGIELRTNPAADLPRVLGHKDQLLEVMINIVSNAIEAMSTVEGRERLLTIESRTDPARGEAVLVVRDTGPGIDSEKAHEIFDAFVTTKPQGMGLGLALCRSIVERHGGRISAESHEDGAMFQLALPINAARPS